MHIYVLYVLDYTAYYLHIQNFIYIQIYTHKYMEQDATNRNYQFSIAENTVQHG